MTARVLSSKIVLLVICFILMLGCATTPKQKQLLTIDSFNDIYKQYLDAYDLQPPTVKAKWKEDIDPLFKTASDAIKAYAKISDPTSLEAKDKSAIYVKAINTAKTLLITYGVTIKEE